MRNSEESAFGSRAPVRRSGHVLASMAGAWQATLECRLPRCDANQELTAS
jgi:hypothetical protein